MSALVLVINTGSSSLKYSLVDADSGEKRADGLVERIGEGTGVITHHAADGEHRVERPVADHEQALRAALDAFAEHGPSLHDADIRAVGHRVVHGGARFSSPARVDDELIEAVTELVPLAPLHNPANLEGLRVARKLFPDLPQVAIFDTAFHQTLPEHAYTYAVPRSWRDDHQIRRYGFHGTSYAFVSRAAADLLGRPLEEVNLIVLHLGNGCSATAIEGGRSVETSMGLTPLEGLVMGTRSGDLDPAVPAHLHRQLGWSLEEIDDALNKTSGLKGLTGHNDFRTLEKLRADGDEDARLGFEVYCHRIRKYVGAYYAVLGHVDAVVFTAGVGQNAPQVRARSLSGLERLGVVLDAERNDVRPDRPTVVSAEGSEVAVLVVPTNEEWEIARQTLAVVDAGGGPDDTGR
ncbi:acetate/propionate family kinase [Nocardioides mesophilus]|uniref:Acetate kinase n=1 Tax=Nocardioides mesophilus TaxID=433659 RepID=A0A7G9R9V4_9ACTN|nr:acetate kinase [Nocardioides mesophilus]QNN52379.1 acetate kinase [Nocardioides mesophilus]